MYESGLTQTKPNPRASCRVLFVETLGGWGGCHLTTGSELRPCEAVLGLELGRSSNKELDRESAFSRNLKVGGQALLIGRLAFARIHARAMPNATEAIQTQEFEDARQKSESLLHQRHATEKHDGKLSAAVLRTLLWIMPEH